MYIQPTGLVRLVAALALLATLGGCAGMTYQYTNQPAVPIGSSLRLNLDADVAADQNRIYIQNQMIVSKAQIDKEQMYCSVVLREYQKAGKPQLSVTPGEFKVWRVRLYNDFIHEPTIYANNDDRYYFPSDGIDFRTEIHLKSSEQPNVRALTCTEHRGEYKYHNTYPNRSNFEAVLGDFVSLP